MGRRKVTKDFAKKKKRLGKGKRPPDNATVTSFKSQSVQMPIQLSSGSGHKGPTTYRNLSLQELLRHIGHHKPSVRKDGLTGIRELLQSTNADELVPSIGEIIKKSSPMFIDSDSNVRHSLYLLLKQVFQTINEEVLKPFFPLLLANLKCGLTHINSSIQENSLKITNILISHCPRLIKPSINDLIPLYLPLVAMKAHPTSINSKQSDIISLYVAKQPVLNQLLEFMLLLRNEDTPTYKAPIIYGNKVWPTGNRISLPTDLTHFYANTPFLVSINPGLFPGIRLNLVSDQVSHSSVTLNQGYENQLIKVLFELWIEIVSGSLMESTTGSSSSPSSDLSLVLATILRLLGLIIDHSHTDSIAESKDKFASHFSKHFVPYFPLFAKGDHHTGRLPPHVLVINQHFARLILTATTKLQPRPLRQPCPYLPAVVSFLSTHLPLASSTLSSTELMECVSIVVDITEGLLYHTHASLPSLATPLFTSFHSLFTSCHPHSKAKLQFLSFIDKIARRVLIYDSPGDCACLQPFMDHFLYPSLSELPRLLPDLVSSLEHADTAVYALKTALTCQIDVVMQSFGANITQIKGILPSLPFLLQRDLSNLVVISTGEDPQDYLNNSVF